MANDDKQQSGPGGAREGAGRPTKYDKPVQPKKIYAPAHHWAYLKERFGGYSPGIQALVDAEIKKEGAANCNESQKRQLS